MILNRDIRDSIRLTLEFLTLVAVVGYATVACNQLNAMVQANRLIRQTLEATKQSADAAVASTRAWVTFKGPSGGWRATAPTTIHFAVDFVNAGRTPAVEIEDGYEFPLSRPNPICPAFTGKPGVLAADQPYLLRRDHEVSEKGFRELMETGRNIWVHGCIRYRDVLTQRSHTTEFCVRYNVTGLAQCGPEYTKMD